MSLPADIPSLALADYTASTVLGASQGRGSPALCPIKGSALEHVHGRVLGCCRVVIAQWSERRQQRSEALGSIPCGYTHAFFPFSCFYPDLLPVAYHAPVDCSGDARARGQDAFLSVTHIRIEPPVLPRCARV